MKYKITIEPFEITEEQYNAFQDNEISIGELFDLYLHADELNIYVDYDSSSTVT